jgi:group II intron reverse transcriptase/maturase
MEDNTRLRSIPITTEEVWNAYLEVRKHGQSAGVDGVSLDQYETRRSDELYKVWNRLSSGSYFPPPVREHEIPKGNGKTRSLGIPTISDRVAQAVVKTYLEPLLEPHFHAFSFAYRPNRNAHQAIEQATSQCYEKAWVIDLDIEKFFDNLDHELLMRALSRHEPAKWILMYVERWLKAPISKLDGTLIIPTKGTPQGGVISPLLSNLYLHYAFDKWMEKNHRDVIFERFADDVIVHCSSKEEAIDLLSAITARLAQCGLRVHPEKTKIVYCKNSGNQRGKWPSSFDFLGITFKNYRAQNKRTGKIFTGFGPVKISVKSQRKILDVLQSKRLTRRTSGDLQELAIELKSHLHGWINSYYGQIKLSLVRGVMEHLNTLLVRWAINRHKRFHRSKWRARLWLRRLATDYPNLFVHWKYGFTP